VGLIRSEAPVEEVPVKTRIWAWVFAGITVLSMVAAARAGDLTWSWRSAFFAAFIALAIVAVEYFKIELPAASFGLYLTLGAVLGLAAGLSLDPWLAGLAMMAASITTDVISRSKPLQVLINASNLALATVAAAAAYRLIADTTQTPLGSVTNISAALLAAFVYAMVNTWGLAIVVAPVLGESPYRLWRSSFSPWIYVVSLMSLGSLIPVLADQHPLALLVLAVPLLGSHFAQRALRNVQEETQATMAGLADALEVRDAYTSQHSIRVTTLVEAILDEMPYLPSDTRKMIMDAARIHDLGKIGIRDAALLKQGPLTAEEFEEVKRHSSIGAELVGRLAIYRRSAAIVRHHHERWDGRGYPDGLKGEQIPLGARIIAVADSFDAMTSDRPYRRALSFEAAVAEIQRNSGTQFDPKVVEAFLRAVADPVRMAAVARARTARPAETPETQVTAMPAD
jgi:HD-GYP domain-containing protein (c-di-GMP phosphodiesterase class II)